ncbi:MAG: hypothetical protein FWF96_03370, partial [Kiritimatiellaeota bacterium]|nr:hypothetical protein [Kiritimatiellota bacterium]
MSLHPLIVEEVRRQIMDEAPLDYLKCLLANIPELKSGGFRLKNQKALRARIFQFFTSDEKQLEKMRSLNKAGNFLTPF